MERIHSISRLETVQKSTITHRSLTNLRSGSSHSFMILSSPTLKRCVKSSLTAAETTSPVAAFLPLT